MGQFACQTVYHFNTQQAKAWLTKLFCYLNVQYSDPHYILFFLPSFLKSVPYFQIHLLADGFTQKNLRQHNGVYNVYYYWHDSGSYNYCRDYSPPIWRYTFIAQQADRRAITGTELYTHRDRSIYIG